MLTHPTNRAGVLACLISLLALVSTPLRGSAEDAQPLKVCATIPDLGSLAREIGGDQVAVTVFCKPSEDPHFVEAKPSFMKALSQADLFIVVGMELEVGYAPVLLTGARNGRVLVNSPGYVDASQVIDALDVPTGTIDRSLGDVHSFGNPHYMLDPLNGLKVAALLRDRMTKLRPEKADYFKARYDDFRKRLGNTMVGEKLAEKYELEKLALLAEHGRLGEFLKEQGEDNLLGGWLSAMLARRGTKYADEHALWVYFARRFGLENIGHMEPVPGIQPTTKQLGMLIDKMRAERIPLILHTPYYDIKHARFVADKTGAKVVTLANQVGAIPGTDDYISMIDVNVRLVAGALEGK
ncbi:MAG: metal ABC transporter substrate-binding protein [Acidobacteriota bacterium]